jgi:hypothetical protein
MLSFNYLLLSLWTCCLILFWLQSTVNCIHDFYGLHEHFQLYYLIKMFIIF